MRRSFAGIGPIRRSNKRSPSKDLWALALYLRLVARLPLKGPKYRFVQHPLYGKVRVVRVPERFEDGIDVFAGGGGRQSRGKQQNGAHGKRPKCTFHRTENTPLAITHTVVVDLPT